jgi:hypothetical protein
MLIKHSFLRGVRGDREDCGLTHYLSLALRGLRLCRRGFNRRFNRRLSKEIINPENHLAASTILARSGECRTTKEHCDTPKHITRAASPKNLALSDLLA